MFVAARVFGEGCRLSICQVCIPEVSDPRNGMVECGIINCSSDITAAFHFRDHGDFVRAGQQCQFSNALPTDEWSSCG